MKSHRAPIHEIMHACKIQPAKFESISPCSQKLGGGSQFEVCIPVSKEAAIEVATAACSEVTVFSDGSGKDGQIGAAMVLFRDGVEHSSLRKHLRSQEHHTVFEAELLGMLLAAELIKAAGHICTAMIGVDSQAAVLATTHGRGAPVSQRASISK